MRTILIILFISIQWTLHSQAENNNIAVLSKPYEDSIVLRIVTTDFVFLEEILRTGYTVERQEVDIASLSKVGEKKTLTSTGKIKLGTQVQLPALSGSKYYSVFEKLPNNLSKVQTMPSNEKSMLMQSLLLASNVICATEIQASKHLGLRFTDTDVAKNKSYVYYISLNSPFDQKTIVLKSVVASNLKQDLPKPILLNVTSTYQQITVHWERTLNNKNYFVYDIERSSDGVNFEVLNEQPILHMYDQSLELDNAYYIDSVSNYIPFQYRLRGWSYFGDRSPASKLGFGMGIDDIPPQKPNLGYLNLIENKGVAIQWTAQDIYGDIESYEVLKSNDLNHGFDKINITPIANNIFEYLETSPVNNYKNYYKVCAIDTAGNKACSSAKRLLVQDKTAPKTPQLIESKIDTNGVVTLSWEANTEDDLWGYYVYRTNDTITNFLRVTNHPYLTTTFKDTVSIKTLTQSLFYTIASIDVRANVSIFSDTISLRRPDKIPPSPALFISGKHTSEGRELNWNPSPFQDVAKQELYRAVSKTEEWKLIKTLKAFTNNYIDTLNTGDTYKYKLITLDESNNKTVSANVLTVRPKKEDKTIVPENVSIIQSENRVKIIWDMDLPIEKLIVFKSANADSKMKRYKIIDCKDCAFWEEELSRNELSAYKIQFKTLEGLYTTTSKTLTLKK